MPKLQPSVQTIEFTLPVSAAPRYLDLSAAASIVNRRFYRQGLNWGVAGFTVIAPPTTSGTITMSKLPNTWVTSNAWEKAFRAWRFQQNEALDDGDQQSVKAKYNDFKIFADTFHGQTAAPHHLIPVDINQVAFLPSPEWLYSQVVVPNDGGVVGATAGYYLHMVGADVPAAPGVNASRGIIQAYADSRSVPQSPDPSTPGNASIGLYTDMFNVGMNDSEIIANAEFRNDELPYDQDNYPGMALNAPELELMNRIFLNPGSTIPGKYKLAGSNVPCGLVKIDAPAVTDVFTVLVHLVPGAHRGYLAETMVDM